jgi:hypothetical protein
MFDIGKVTLFLILVHFYRSFFENSSLGINQLQAVGFQRAVQGTQRVGFQPNGKRSPE